MRNLTPILLIIILILCCQKSPDQDVSQMAELKKQQTDHLKHFPSISPVKGGKILNRFGQQIDSLINNGIDIVVEQDANVVATAAGKVVEMRQGAAKDEALIIIDHGFGFQTKYFNLSETIVRANQSVKRWSVIGRIKKTTDRRALLHYEVLKDGKQVDPEKFLF